MKLGSKILLSYLLIFSLGIYFLVHGERQNIRFRYLEGVEDALVDQARVLASFISSEIEADNFSPEKLHMLFGRIYGTKLSAQIYKMNKERVDVRVYITDKNGILIFDSKKKDAIGSDYSQWRDVHLTLQGKYGARSTQEDPYNPATSTLFVAAPIMINNDIGGVLTVAKPTTSINNFLKIAKLRIKIRSFAVIFFVISASIIIMLLITRPIKLLTRYANYIREGKKAELPKLDRSEIGDMGRAFEKMREALEGKKYVEKYVQALTHEIKSPISAIQGASELLEEEMPPEQRSRFLTNIQNETDRIQQLVDRMLALSSLESRNSLDKNEAVPFKELVDDVLESIMPILSQNRLKMVKNYEKDVTIMGDSFLLRQAVSNLVQNASDFSPPDSQLTITIKTEKDNLQFIVEDQGPGLQDFAHEKVFEKFFSMQRPGNGKKSTGLGLNFVKEIANLHNGSIHLENRTPQGARAVLTLPLKRS